MAQAATFAALGTGLGCSARRLATEAAGATASMKLAPRPSLAVDVHCHAFNAHDLPLDGFLRNFVAGAVATELHKAGEALVRYADPLLARFTTPVAEFLIAQTPTDEKERLDAALTNGTVLSAAPPLARKDLTKKILDSAGGLPKALRDAIASIAERLVDVLSIVTGYRYQVVTTLLDDYEGVGIFTPSLIDFDHWTNRRLRVPSKDCTTSLPDQLELHSKVSLCALRGLLPTRTRGRRVCVHPFAPFNPYRDDALELVKTAVQSQGYLGVKLYPATGFLPTNNARLDEFRKGDTGARLDKALDDLYAYCESNEVPILTHAADSNGFGDDLSWRGSPWAWAEVLAQHGSLRLDFGHFGHMKGVPPTGEIKEKELLDCLVWAKHIAGLMEKHEGVYADLSNSPLGLADPPADPTKACPADKEETATDDHCYRTRFQPFLEGLLEAHPVVAKRIMYGSDWWLNALGGGRGDFRRRLAEIMPKIKGVEGPAFFEKNAREFLGLADGKGKSATRIREFVKKRAPDSVGDLVWNV